MNQQLTVTELYYNNDRSLYTVTVDTHTAKYYFGHQIMLCALWTHTMVFDGKYKMVAEFILDLRTDLYWPILQTAKICSSNFFLRKPVGQIICHLYSNTALDTSKQTNRAEIQEKVKTFVMQTKNDSWLGWKDKGFPEITTCRVYFLPITLQITDF